MHKVGFVSVDIGSVFARATVLLQGQTSVEAVWNQLLFCQILFQNA